MPDNKGMTDKTKPRELVPLPSHNGTGVVPRPSGQSFLDLASANAASRSAATQLPASGLLGLLPRRVGVWLTEQNTETEVRRLRAEQRLVEQRRALAEAQIAAGRAVALAELDARLALAEREWDARQRVSQAALQAEEAEADRTFHQTVRAAAPEQARRILNAELETEVLLLERAQMRRQRLGGTPTPTPPAPVVESPAGPGVARPAPAPAGLETHLSDRQVQSLALRALTRFSNLAPEQAERAWAEWRQELTRRLPPYGAAEVARRAEELRGLAG